MKVSVYSSKPFEIPFLEESKGDENAISLDMKKEALSPSTVELAKGSDAVSIFTNDDASESVIQALSDIGVKYIATRAAGFDNINVAAAKSKGIKVANVPEYSPYSIAEHSVSMIMALNRKLILADQKVKFHDFTLDDLIGFDLHGKTVGIIGLGKIGGIVAKIMNGFGCNILGFDINPDPVLEEDFGVQYVSMDKLYKESDIISIHAPLNEHTKYMINKDSLSGMKDGVMIVNTGRGPIVNTQDAIEALKTGKIGALGLDVYEKEKGLFFYDHSKDILTDDLFARLLTFKNVLITGHQAFLTKNALKNIADTTIYNLSCWAKGKESQNEL